MLYRDTAAVVPDTAARTVTVRLCGWNQPRNVIDPDGTRYREQYPPGSLELASDVHVVDSHTGALIGRADPDTLGDDGTGPTVELTIARTTAGNDTLAALDARVIRSVSMEVEPIDASRADDLVTRTRSIVHGIAFAFRPPTPPRARARRRRSSPPPPSPPMCSIERSRTFGASSSPATPTPAPVTLSPVSGRSTPSPPPPTPTRRCRRCYTAPSPIRSPPTTLV